MLVDVAEKELLRAVIGLADQVDHPFVVNVQVLTKAGAQNLPRLTGEGD
jgi:hypothetical protein